jgi:hypothetical protein
MCSNSAAISHMTQCEMPFRRSAIAVAAATAPTPTLPCVHSHSVTPAVAAISAIDSAWLTISKPVTSRICWCTVPRNSCIADFAKPASRRACEKSFTVAMFVYASVMRPVISERCVGLLARDAPQARHEEVQGYDVEHDPDEEGPQKTDVETTQHRKHRHEVDDDEHQELGEDQPDVAHGERGLHHLGGDAAGEFVLVEAHALAEQQPVEIPPQQHREVAGERLLLDRRLQRDEQHARGQHGGEKEQGAALLGPQQRGLGVGEPIDDASHHAEQQRLERADRRGEQRHREDVAAQPLRAFPQERKEAARRRRGGASG